MNMDKTEPFIEVILFGIQDGPVLESRIEKPVSRVTMLRQMWKTLDGVCDHRVVYDVLGYPYDVRICFTCGKHRGLV
jgi:hypothetical protein